MSDVVYVLGDIHGRLDLLNRAENILSIVSKKVPSNDPSVRLIGDYIDHGPDSKGVMDKILSSRLANMPMQVMLGNHDIWLTRVVNMIKSNNPSCSAWLNDSTLSTIRSYGINVSSVPRDFNEQIRLLTTFARSVPDEHLTYIRDYMATLSVDAGSIFVHAGIDGRKDLNNQNIDVCVNGLNIPGGFLESGWSDVMPVVMGHIVKPSPFVSVNKKIIGLDTHAYDSNILTCGIISNGSIAGFLAITPRSGIDFIPVVYDDENISIKTFKLVGKWWKDVFSACKEPPVLVFKNKERENFFTEMVGLTRFRTSKNVGAYRKDGYRIMPIMTTSKS